MKWIFIFFITFIANFGVSESALAAHKNFSLDCQWSNNLELKRDQDLASSNSLNPEQTLEGRGQPLSLLAPKCGENKKTCFGQVTCSGHGKNRTGQFVAFDFYTYAVCVTPDEKGRCLSAEACMMQSGALNEFESLESRKGYIIENSSGKFRGHATEGQKGVK